MLKKKVKTEKVEELKVKKLTDCEKKLEREKKRIEKEKEKLLKQQQKMLELEEKRKATEEFLLKKKEEANIAKTIENLKVRQLELKKNHNIPIDFESFNN